MPSSIAPSANSVSPPIPTTEVTRDRCIARAAPHGRLAAVTCHFNPCGYRKLRENYFRFRAAFSGCPLYTLEVSFDGQFHLPADWQIHAGEQNLMWQKEPLINEAVRRLPDHFDQVAWIDADMLFLNPAWAEQTSRLLCDVPVAQLFDNCHYTTAHGLIDHSDPSLMRKRRERLPGHGQPGGAWAARREIVERHGLFPWNVVGGGDANLSDALFGQFAGTITRISTQAMNAVFREWAVPFHEDIRSRVGCTSGDLVHLYHGTHVNRRYVEHAKILRDEQFDPRADLRRGCDGLLEWTTRKSRLREGVRQYFEGRREDH